MSADGAVNRPLGRCHTAVHQGEIAPGDRVLLELPGKVQMSGIILGRHQNSRSLLVKTMDDSRAQFAADSGKSLTVVKQGVDQGTPGMAGSGVNDETGRFVDDDEVGIFIKNSQRDGLGEGRHRAWRGEANLDGGTGFEFFPGFGRSRGEKNAAVVNEVFQLGTGQVGECSGEKRVKPLPMMLGGDGQTDGQKHLPDRTLDFAGLPDHDIDNGAVEKSVALGQFGGDPGIKMLATLLEFIVEERKDVVVLDPLFDFFLVVESDVRNDRTSQAKGKIGIVDKLGHDSSMQGHVAVCCGPFCGGTK